MYFILDNVWCSKEGVVNTLNFIFALLNILRWAVPIILIVMVMFDIGKTFVNPDSKDGLKPLASRIIAAILVFLVPTFISLVFKVIDIGLGSSHEDNSCYSVISGSFQSKTSLGGE